jgi:hypothetical protein
MLFSSMDELDYIPTSGTQKAAIRGEILPTGHIRKHLIGDIRKNDGYVYCGYWIDKPSGRFVEKWLNPELYKNRKIKDKKTKAQKYKENSNDILLRNKISRQKNIHKYREREKRHKLKNKDKYNANHRAWTKKNRHKKMQWISSRKARKRNACLMLHKDQLNIINSLYELRKRVSDCIGIVHHVDHIIPISRGGYHIHTNMQVIPAITNLRKHNKLPYEIAKAD